MVKIDKENQLKVLTLNYSIDTWFKIELILKNTNFAYTNK